MQQLLLDLLPPPAPTLDNFVAGRNAEGLSALRTWLTQPGTTTCLLFWGEAHCGCSHLLRAAVADTNATANVSSQYADSRNDPALAAFPDLPEDCTLFAADAVDALDPEGQVRLFNIFNRLKTRGGRLLAASRQPPAALQVREDLRTRLGSGLVYRLTPLSDAEKTAALAERAHARGLALPAGALDYLFRHAPRDMGSLTAIIDALDRFSLEHQRPVTLPLLRGLLNDLQPAPAAPAGPHPTPNVSA